jgi:hypothetical protein
MADGVEGFGFGGMGIVDCSHGGLAHSRGMLLNCLELSWSFERKVAFSQRRNPCLSCGWWGRLGEAGDVGLVNGVARGLCG